MLNPVKIKKNNNDYTPIKIRKPINPDPKKL